MILEKFVFPFAFNFIKKIKHTRFFFHLFNRKLCAVPFNVNFSTSYRQWYIRQRLLISAPWFCLVPSLIFFVPSNDIFLACGDAFLYLSNHCTKNIPQSLFGVIHLVRTYLMTYFSSLLPLYAPVHILDDSPPFSH